MEKVGLKEQFDVYKKVTKKLTQYGSEQACDFNWHLNTSHPKEQKNLITYNARF